MAKQLKRQCDVDEESRLKAKELSSRVIESQAFGKSRNPFDLKNSDYEFDESHKPWEPGDNPLSIHTVPDLIRALKTKEANVEIDAKFFAVKDGEAHFARAKNKESFIKTVEGNKKRTFRESIDSFSFESSDNVTGSGGMVGHDYVPLLGGPFTKQLYYTDYLKMHNAAFYAYHHSPIARRYVNMISHFTLGRGFKVKANTPEGQAIWDAFCEVNNFYENFKPLSREYSDYGEVLVHWLPDNMATFRYNVPAAQIPRAVIPRIRLLDPSTIWEIITYPEDLSPSGVLAYQQIFPTQWQMYTTGGVPGTKFIYQQIPAQDVMHFKTNVMTNEKRGRSDLFPVMTYDKRMRDAVNYSLVNEMKNAAWCIDTTIDGSQADIDAYVDSQRKLGTVAGAGSEFVHSKKVQRKYDANNTGASKDSMVFDWCMSMIAMGTGIPIPYWGIHLGATGTRSNAIVGTEPVAKIFEDRQDDFETMIKKIAARLFRYFNIKAEVEVTFPEIITQDRSAKLKDLALAVSEGWINRELAADIAAKELGIDSFKFATDAPATWNVPGAPALTGTPEPLSSAGMTPDAVSATKAQDRSGI